MATSNVRTAFAMRYECMYCKLLRTRACKRVASPAGRIPLPKNVGQMLYSIRYIRA